ncbi:MAG: bifunctional homocysteine S-methyltransferase/methylenetetrahydrofolate reductase [Planctomycetes bacterium]|nr:bifunctional homocysteine S-methyltransferase/methylenetetrahydrofolate reductase [Planctomycetota bacterium]
MKSKLIELLGERGVAVCDGAMGTMLYNRGVFVNRSYDELNLSNPSLVSGVHGEYVAAGSDLIETNTFAANRFKLAGHGCEELAVSINREGARLACEVARPAGVLVAGSIGPLGVRIEPWGPVALEEARAAFREQIEALRDGGVDLLIFETFYHLPELEQAVLAAQEVCELPLVAQVTVTEEGATPEGIAPRAFGRTLADWGLDGIGVNCGVGPGATLEAIEELRDAIEVPITAQPNAGQPRNVQGRNIYMSSSPDFMASYARRFVKAGVRLIGGCCGTTPDHIRAMKEAVVALRPTSRPPRRGDRAASTIEIQSVPAVERSLLARRLAKGEWPICVQVRAPIGPDVGPTVKRFRELKEAGVELVSVIAGRGGARMAPFAVAQILQREAGVEAIAELPCRHRTLLGLQSEVLGADALDLHNLILVTGPPVMLGDVPDATADLEVDSIGLTNMVRRLNEGRDVAGQPLGQATSILIGVHLDPFAVDLEHELRRFAWKVEAGANYALTTPVLSAETLIEFLPRIASSKIPIVATVPLITSYRGAERLRTYGAARPPQALLDRLQRAEREGSEREEGVAIATEAIRALRDHVQGIQLVTPWNRLGEVPAILAEVARS